MNIGIDGWLSTDSVTDCNVSNSDRWSSVQNTDRYDAKGNGQRPVTPSHLRAEHSPSACRLSLLPGGALRGVLLLEVEGLAVCLVLSVTVVLARRTLRMSMRNLSTRNQSKLLSRTTPSFSKAANHHTQVQSVKKFTTTSNPSTVSEKADKHKTQAQSVKRPSTTRHKYSH